MVLDYSRGVTSMTAIASGGSGGFLYTESRSESGVHHMSPDRRRPWVYTQPQHRETWWGDDDSGLRRIRSGRPRFFTEEGQRRWEAAGSPKLPEGLHQTVMAAGCLERRGSKRRAERLPRHPVELGVAIKREPHGSRTPAEDDFLGIQGLLHIPELSLDLCRALYEVALCLPGARDRGQVTDREKREGLGIEMEVGGYLHRLVFDPHAWRLLGEQQTLTDPGYDYAPVGTVTGWAVYLREQRVPELPDDAPSIPGPPRLPGQEGILREIQPGLIHATGPSDKTP